MVDSAWEANEIGESIQRSVRARVIIGGHVPQLPQFSLLYPIVLSNRQKPSVGTPYDTDITFICLYF